MKKLLLAGAAALVVATPAVARDNSPYVGIEGGVLFPKKQTISGNIDFTTNGKELGRAGAQGFLRRLHQRPSTNMRRCSTA